MKISRIITLGAVAAAIFLSTSSLMAQADTGGNNTDTGAGQGGGQGGGQRRRGGPGGGGNFDPAAMQQRMMDNVRDQLGYTNDTDWSAVQPLVQKVMDARMAVGFGGRGGFRGNRGGGQGGPGGGGAFGQQPNPDRDALQKAIDDNAPVAQINAALAKYRASQKDKQTKLETAQANLLKVLTKKQEAEATILGLVP